MKNEYLPYPAKIIKIQYETFKTKTFHIEFCDKVIRDSFTYEQGQFLESSVLGVGEAPISIASSNKFTNTLELTIKKSGKVTQAIHNLNIGDVFYLRGPYGKSFPIEKFIGKNIYFIAGGIGLAPLKGLINNILDSRNDFGRIIILYGAKNPDEICFKEEIEKWKKVNNIEVLVTVDKPDEAWAENTGIITELWEKTKIDPENSVAIVCGPSAMIECVVMKLNNDSHFAPQDIFMVLERYMKCGIGKCGHCNIESKFVCVDGPVFTYEEIKDF